MGFFFCYLESTLKELGKYQEDIKKVHEKFLKSTEKAPKRYSESVWKVLSITSFNKRGKQLLTPYTPSPPLLWANLMGYPKIKNQSYNSVQNAQEIKYLRETMHIFT